MLIIANQLLLINTTMLLPIPSNKPPQAIHFVLAQSLPHLRRGELLRAHKVVEHLALVDVRQHRGDGVGLTRQKGVASAEEDDDCDDDHVEQDEER